MSVSSTLLLQVVKLLLAKGGSHAATVLAHVLPANMKRALFPELCAVPEGQSWSPFTCLALFSNIEHRASVEWRDEGLTRGEEDEFSEFDEYFELADFLVFPSPYLSFQENEVMARVLSSSKFKPFL